jgi:hypothetical protein
MTYQKIGGRYKTFQGIYFLVKWLGCPDDESTWEPGTSLEDTSESIDKFYVNYPKTSSLTTWEQVWKGQGVPVREIGKYN